MSDNGMDTRPRVCLTKPNRSVAASVERELPSFTPEHIAEEVIPCERELPSFTPEHIADEIIPSTPHQREITPVHLCAEYSPEPQTSDFAKALCEMITNDYLVYFFHGISCVSLYDVEIQHNRVTLSRIINPLTGKLTIESKSLNALQDLGEYMASTGSTVNGIISLLISREDDFSEMPLYFEWCKLLKNIRDNDVSEIEAVLNGERDDCYSSLGCCSKAECFDVLPKRVHCYLFTALQDVLERETEVMVNPLFLFLCENLRCYPAKHEQGIKMLQEVYSMYQLTAYGAFNESRLALAPLNNRLRIFAQANNPDERMFNSLYASIIFMGIGCIPIVFGFESSVLGIIAISGGFAVGISNAIFSCIAEKIYRNSEKKRFYQHKQLGYMHWKSNFIPTTAAQSAAMQIESLKMLADEITGERKAKI